MFCLLPFAAMGLLWLKDMAIDKFNAKKGKVKIIQISATGKEIIKGYSAPDQDGNVYIGKAEDSKIYPYDRNMTYLNRYNCAVAVYTPDFKQVDLVTGEKSSLMIKELSNIIAATYSTAVASIRRNEKVTELQKWAPIIIGFATLVAVWYFCKDIPAMAEQLNRLVTVK